MCGMTQKATLVFDLTFVLVSQPTFEQQAQTKSIGLRKISVWAGACNARPCSPQPNGLRFRLVLRKVPDVFLKKISQGNPFVLFHLLCIKM